MADENNGSMFDLLYPDDRGIPICLYFGDVNETTQIFLGIRGAAEGLPHEKLPWLALSVRVVLQPACGDIEEERHCALLRSSHSSHFSNWKVLSRDFLSSALLARFFTK